MVSLSRAAPAPTSFTGGHLKVHKYIVEELFFEVEDEVSVGPYTLDMYIRELHVGVEYDGALYHSTPKQRKHDAERDIWILENSGIVIYRVPEKTLQVALSNLESFLELHSNDVEERRSKGYDLVK